MLILASASPQRKRLLKEAGIRFKVDPSHIPESNVGKNCRAVVLRLALLKARAVAKRHPDRWVLGADSLVYGKGQILGKPKDAKDALRILRLLNGSWSKVYTGVALVNRRTRMELSGVAVSNVKTRRMPEAWLKRYAHKHPDKAGGYAVQDHDDPFVERVVGPRDNVIGLPVALVKRLLAKAAI